MKISVVLEALTGSFETDMARASKTAQKQMRDLEKTVISAAKKALAALTVGVAAHWLKDSIKESIEFASTLDDMAKSTGISVEKLSALEFAATKSGTELEALHVRLNKFNKTIAEAAGGSKAQAAAFSAMGISLKDASGNIKSTDVLLAEVAGKFAGYADGANKAALAQELFGKSSADLIPLLNEGSEGLAAFEERAKALGLVMDSETIGALESFGDELQTSDDIMRALKLNMASEFLPTLHNLNEAFISASTAGGPIQQLFTSLVPVLGATARGLSWVAEYFQLLGVAVVGSYEAIKVWATDGLDAANRAAAETVKRIDSLVIQYDLFRKETEKPWSPPMMLDDHARGLMATEEAGRKKQAPHVDAAEIEKAAKEAARARKAAFDIINAQMKASADYEKEIGRERLAVLDDQNTQGLVSLTDYYAQRFDIEALNAGKEMQLLEEEIRQTKELRSKAVEQSEVASFDSKLVELTGKLKQAQLEQSNAHIDGMREEAAAMREQQRLLEDLAISARANADNAGLTDQSNELQHQRAMMNVSDREYYAELQHLEDSAYESAVAIERARLSSFRGTQQQREIEAAASAYRLESIESDHADNIKEINRQAQEEIAKYALAAQKVVEDSFADFFTNVMDGTMSVKDAFRQLAEDIIRQINRIAAEQLASKMFGAGSDSGGSGWVGQLFSAAASYFGSGSGSQYGSVDFANQDPFGAVQYQGMAKGGSVYGNTPYLVGERGPEMFVPKSSGDIVPNHKLGGGTVNNFAVTVMAPEGRISKESNTQLRDRLGRAVGEAMRRNR